MTDLGITYQVKYVGCIRINTSMRSLDLELRSCVAKECIVKVCDFQGIQLPTHGYKRRKDKRVIKMIPEDPILDHAGSKVNIHVTDDYVTLTLIDTNEMIGNHEMQNISFASGGDSQTADFVAYVAKDVKYGRACFVLECGVNLATDVITTIGQAFEIRFKGFVSRQKLAQARIASKSTSLINPNLSCNLNLTNSSGSATSNEASTSVLGCPTSSSDLSSNSIPHATPNIYSGGAESDRDYYNDLPGKVPPPDLKVKAATATGLSLSSTNCHSPKSPSLLSCSPSATLLSSSPSTINNELKIINSNPILGQVPQAAPRNNISGSKKSSNANFDPLSNLIDLNTYILCDANKQGSKDKSNNNNNPGDPSSDKCSSNATNGAIPKTKNKHEYVNTNLGSSSKENDPKDPFDMQPFNSTIQELMAEVPKEEVSPTESQPERLTDQEWFHGKITRSDAELLLIVDGDFLVRESREINGQYVLSGRIGGQCRHLLLVDLEQNVVRTKDQIFDSVNHLIDYHLKNKSPIISADSTLFLEHPIKRTIITSSDLHHLPVAL